MPLYNKVVRDRIPEIIEAAGHQCEYRLLSDETFLPYLEEKLAEELEEYMSSKSVVELTDIIEVINRISELRGISVEELEQIRQKKRLERGGFERNFFLIKTS